MCEQAEDIQEELVYVLPNLKTTRPLGVRSPADDERVEVRCTLDFVTSDPKGLLEAANLPAR